MTKRKDSRGQSRSQVISMTAKIKDAISPTLATIAIFLILASSAFAQAVRYDNAAYTTSGQVPAGALTPVLAIPGSTIAVCADSACAGRATTYTSSAAGTPCSTLAQLTAASGGVTCTSLTDAQGNFGFWILPGSYFYRITLPPLAGGGSYTYPISVGASAGCPLGATCDANYATLALAYAAAGTGTLYITRSWNAQTTASYISGSTIFLGNGKIQPSSGQTVTLSQNTQCPSPQQCYDPSLGGAIAFSAPPNLITPIQFGASTSDSTGTTNSTSFQAALTAALITTSTHGASVSIPCSSTGFNLASTITVSGFRSQFIAPSPGCVTLNWKGGATGGMINVRDCYQCTIGGFNIGVASASFPLQYGILQFNSGAGSFTATQDHYENIQIAGGLGYITTGMYFGTGTDGNNDFALVENVIVNQPGHSCFTINHSQVYETWFLHSSCYGGGYSQYGVEAIAGNFHWEGGGLGADYGSDFYIGTPNSGTYTIEKTDSENSAQFLITGGPNGNTVNTIISGVRYAVNCLGDSQAAIKAGTCTAPGGASVAIQNEGPVLIVNSNFGGVAAIAQTMTMQFAGTFTLINARIDTSLTTYAAIFNLLPYSINTVVSPDAGVTLNRLPDILAGTSLVLGGALTVPGTLGVTGLATMGAITSSGAINMNGGVLRAPNATAYIGTVNYVGGTAGVNNAITTTVGQGPPLATGLCISAILSNTLQAGANTLSYLSAGAIAIKSSKTLANISTAWAQPGAVIVLCYNGANWLDVSQ